MKTTRESKSVILRSDLELIPNIYQLQKLGAGHDGEIYKYKNLVLKLLKYDVQIRKSKGLMTFEKTIYFQEELCLRRITKPIDILLDNDGIYVGYVMNYLEDLSNSKLNTKSVRKTIGDYTLEELICVISDLIVDFETLSNKKVVGRDINRGSFILTEDFLHLCDMDKYQNDASNARDLNKRNLNFVISKLLYFEMMNFDFVDKMERRKLIEWIKCCCNDSDFIFSLLKEITNDNSVNIHDYAVKKVKKLLLK